jgi:hypothetical protein
MKKNGSDDVITVEELLASSRAQIARLTPAEAFAETEGGALLIDIRPIEQRKRDGSPLAAQVVPRNVLEWRLDPRSAYRDQRLVMESKPGFAHSRSTTAALM